MKMHRHMNRGGLRGRMFEDGLDEGRGGPGRGKGRGRGFGRGMGGGGGSSGGGRYRMFGPGQLRLVLLHLLAEEPRHGYELIKAIEDLTGGAYAPSPGVVYPTLSLLSDEGLAVEQPGEGRRAFAATQAGRAEVAANAEALQLVLARLAQAGEGRKERPAPIVRAIAGLRAALHEREAGGIDRDVALSIAAIIDEATQRIERL